MLLDRQAGQTAGTFKMGFTRDEARIDSTVASKLAFSASSWFTTPILVNSKQVGQGE